MSKLKTLKDIEPFHCYECEGNINPENLKYEAVKWIKHWKKHEYDKRTKPLKYDLAFVNRISAFIEFFNLTEEDLK